MRPKTMLRIITRDAVNASEKEQLLDLAFYEGSPYYRLKTFELMPVLRLHLCRKSSGICQECSSAPYLSALLYTNGRSFRPDAAAPALAPVPHAKLSGLSRLSTYARNRNHLAPPAAITRRTTASACAAQLLSESSRGFKRLQPGTLSLS